MTNLEKVYNIKRIRDLTGVTLSDAKNALDQTNSFDEALKLMQAKGLSKASSRSHRVTQAGLIHSYVHDGRIGVLLEVNCETDFVAKTDDFKDFVKDVALQIAASQPIYMTPEDVDESTRQNQRETIIELAKIDNVSKDKLESVVEAQLEKNLAKLCLLSQNFNKDPKLTINDLLQTLIAKLGENIVIAKFVRFELGKVQADLVAKDV